MNDVFNKIWKHEGNFEASRSRSGVGVTDYCVSLSHSESHSLENSKMLVDVRMKEKKGDSGK